MSPAWNRLIRFVASDGNTYYGEPIVASEDATVDQLATQGTLEAKVISGDALSDDAVVTDQVVKVSKLLAPLAQSEVPIFKCVGLNYKAHSKHHSTTTPLHVLINGCFEIVAEGGRTPPPYPSIFIKPTHSHADAFEDIPIPKLAHPTTDYEGELVCVCDAIKMGEEDDGSLTVIIVRLL